MLQRNHCIVIVSFNKIVLLKSCIESILASNAQLQIIVIDNNSEDGSREWLSNQNFITLILLKKNKGASFAFNTGLKEAFQLGFEYIYTTDEDTYFDPNFFANTSLIISQKQPNFIIPKVLDFNGEINPKNIITYKNEKIYLATWIGSCFNRSVFAECGFPYNNLFLFFDDTEFFLRLHRKNLTGLFADDAIVYHESKGNNASEYFNNYFQTTNSKYFLRNHYFFMKKEKSSFWVASKITTLVLVLFFRSNSPQSKGSNLLLFKNRLAHIKCMILGLLLKGKT